MTASLIGWGGWQVVAYFIVLFALVVPLGGHMARVYLGKSTFLSPALQPVEGLIYRACGVDPDREMSWKEYALALLALSFSGFALLYAILIGQGVLPLNPQNLPGLSPDLAFNTAVSFITNTNWQSYSGETVMTNFSQMAGLTVQNFVSAAVGMAALAAMIRGMTRRKAAGIGNFWADLVRSILYILLPLSFILALVLGAQGVVQTFSASIDAHTLEGTKQTIALGPVASQEAIKMLGTNGGGFFNVNSAHPFENPNPLTNFLELVAILVIPTSLCHSFGIMVGDRRQGFALLAAMSLVFVPLMLFGIAEEQGGNPHLASLGIDQTASAQQPGGNMEGKETRFGIVNSGLWAAATTAASNGSVNSMHDSYTPLGGMVPLLLMKFGEVIYGGVGSGLYGMLIFVVITVFIAGLMVGRTPEYLGKKIQSFEMKMASIAILAPSACVLIGTALGVMTEAGRAGLFNSGPQGYSEVLYAFTSAANNNGSAFAGLSANSPFYNTALGLCMLVGRYFVLIPVLAIGGSLAAKNTTPPSAGTLPTHTPLFVLVLIFVLVLVGILTYAPTLALGPVIAYLQMIGG
ncbi:potassium-transporting ATPase subunit KdpA [Beijerinckia mobilis]|uniref:potassium-transporting ATPase subunit KdpA n=1 Tax=Beijerinckia mobilis TaxID=231434 RepID=UPI00054E8EDD|nr:potassium-transporting ATPase subunit KdpA [Beijerinckia mobilis]